MAVIDWADDLRRTAIAGGDRNHFGQEGSLNLLLRGSIDSSHDDADAAFAFLNTVGDIIEEMEALSGTAGYLGFVSTSVVQGPSRPLEDEQNTVGDYYEIILRIGFE